MTHAEWRHTGGKLTGDPQGFILGPILFNIFINDIFFFLDKTRIGNYADDNTTYGVEKDVIELLKILESDTCTVLNWFRCNEMKANQGKCHLIIADINHKNYDSKSFVYLEDAFLESEDIVKLLGILIDKELTFEDHVRSLLRKANQKFFALMRVSKYMSKDKLRILLKSFIESQFNYCPLIWMCHSKKMHNRINKLHERALRVVYKTPCLTAPAGVHWGAPGCTGVHRGAPGVAPVKFQLNFPTPEDIMQPLFFPGGLEKKIM